MQSKVQEPRVVIKHIYPDYRSVALPTELLGILTALLYDQPNNPDYDVTTNYVKS